MLVVIISVLISSTMLKIDVTACYIFSEIRIGYYQVNSGYKVWGFSDNFLSFPQRGKYWHCNNWIVINMSDEIKFFTNLILMLWEPAEFDFKLEMVQKKLHRPRKKNFENLWLTWNFKLLHAIITVKLETNKIV